MPVIWRIETHKRVISTQDILKEKAAAGAPEGLVVHALEQTGGYGRHGRRWDSAPGNLFLSLLLRPEIPIESIGQLSLLAGLAVGETVRQFAGETVELKWPNDVMLGGKKCAGLLLETEIENGRLQWIAVGIGVNICSAPPEGAFVTEAPEIDLFRDALLGHVGSYYEQWQGQGFAAIRQDWLDMSFHAGTPISVKIGSRVETGRFYDIDEHGSLLLEGAGGAVKKITAGDVYV